ncbi:hypothetical protein VTK56DRAFT_7972 [Thermocarpiscus australiensis]
MPSLNVQVQLWVNIVQMARRVAAFKHRVEKSKTMPASTAAGPIELRFGTCSMRYHKQKPDPLELKRITEARCCYICSRSEAPDIFEVVNAEESVVPRLEVFQRWLDQVCEQGSDDEKNVDLDGEDDGLSWVTIARLYAEEFGWQCCIATGQEGNTAWQETRASDARRRFKSLETLFVGKSKRRWDILG